MKRCIPSKTHGLALYIGYMDKWWDPAQGLSEIYGCWQQICDKKDFDSRIQIKNTALAQQWCSRSWI